MMHVVLKRFFAEGRELSIGDVIETSHWKNERLLLEHRFIGKPSAPQRDAAVEKASARVDRTSSGESSAPAVLAATPTTPALASPKPKPSPVVGRVPVARVQAKG